MDDERSGQPDTARRSTFRQQRRSLLKAGAAASLAAGSTLAAIARSAATPVARPTTSLGIVIYALNLRREALKSQAGGSDLFEPLAFLEYCGSLGAGGIQLPLGVREVDYCAQLRQKAESRGMFVEAIVNLPRREGDVDRFDAEIRTALQSGVACARATLVPGRRYERYESLAAFTEAVEVGRKALLRAVPILERHRMRLALENHKDQRVEDRLELLKQIASPWVGACLDVGNSFTLMEDPLAVVEAYAPWAFTVHVKDHAVREYPDGFLLADVPLGDGFLDLKDMVATIRRAKPDIHFNLETIIRDPLEIPCLTEKFWASMGPVPGADLARTLRIVRAKQAPALRRISALSPQEQVACEAAGVEKSLTYASQTLGLKHEAPRSQ